MRIIQVAPTVAYGDAIGNHIVLMDKCLRNHLYSAGMYAQGIHRKYQGIVHPVTSMPELSEKDIMLYHMCIGSPLNKLLKEVPCRKIMAYHNITPPEFFVSYEHNKYQVLKSGLSDVREVRPYVDSCIAMSEFDKQDLVQMGYSPERIWVMPSYLIPFEDYGKEPDSNILNQYSDGWTNILFVGRLAPNKKQEDVIRAYAWYKQHINPRSRLILVGSEHTPNYSAALRNYVAQLGVKDVIFPGHISFSAIIAFYKCASVFLCMSEHEGFCVPLIEAMYFDVPVIAYASTAIPGTLDGSGILVDTKDPVLIGNLIERLNTDSVFRDVILERQRMRLAEIQSYQNADDFIQYLKQFISTNSK